MTQIIQGAGCAQHFADEAAPTDKDLANPLLDFTGDPDNIRKLAKAIAQHNPARLVGEEFVAELGYAYQNGDFEDGAIAASVFGYGSNEDLSAVITALNGLKDNDIAEVLIGAMKTALRIEGEQS
jgi:hypothetical protein